MLFRSDKSYVIGEYIENWNDIKDGSGYVILTQDDGIVFKIAYNQIKKNRTLLLKSLNPEYDPYEIPVNEVKEVWKFCNYLSSEMPDEGLPKNDLLEKFSRLEKEIKNMRTSLE